MARSRDVMLLAALMIGAATAPGSATPIMAATGGDVPLVPVQYYNQERPYYQPAPRYYAPRPRRVCWTEYRRVLAGYNRYGQPFYRRVPRRVCGYR